MVPKSKSPVLSSSLLYLNNVYYIIHIFCRLFFCVFFPISTHFFKKSYHYIILQCYIFFGYFTMYYYLLYTFLPYNVVFFWLKDAFFHVFFSQHFFVILQLFSFYYSFFCCCVVYFFFSFISCNKDVFPRKCFYF